MTKLKFLENISELVANDRIIEINRDGNAILCATNRQIYMVPGVMLLPVSGASSWFEWYKMVGGMIIARSIRILKTRNEFADSNPPYMPSRTKSMAMGKLAARMKSKDLAVISEWTKA